MQPTYYRRKPAKRQPEFEDTSHPWDKMPDESEHAHKAFRIFADLGYARDLSKVAMRVYGDKWESHIRFVEGWYDAHRWEERARLFDDFIEKHHEDFKESQKKRAAHKIAEAIPDITEVAIDGAMGKRRIERTQGTLIMNLMDRGGPSKQESAKTQQNIHLNIEAPPLPDQVRKQNAIDLDDAEYEDMDAEAEKLRPSFEE